MTLAGIGVIGIGAIFIGPEVLAIAAGVVAVTILALATIAVIDWAKSGLPSIKHRKWQIDLSTLGKTADNPNGPVLRGGRDLCKGKLATVICTAIGIGAVTTIATKLLKSYQKGAYGDDESVDKLPNVATPTPTSTQTLSPTMTPTSTPTSTPSSTPTSTPTITPTPHIIPKSSNHSPMIPI